MDILLRHGALDQDKEVLRIATKSQRENVLAVLLKYHSHLDQEYRVNKKALMNFFFSQDDSPDGATYESPTSSIKSMFPTNPVSINWHNQIWVPYIKESWLLQSCFLHNPVLASVNSNQMCALFAITRIDISNNNIEYFPDCLFQLQSLRVLNASYNKIKWLPGSNWDPVAKQPLGETCITQDWQCSCLEEVQLQYNQLKELPAALFNLPNLHKLQASHNDLEVIPYQIWTSAKMTEVNLSHNHLKALPWKPEDSSLVKCVLQENDISTKKSQVKTQIENNVDLNDQNDKIVDVADVHLIPESENEVIHINYWREHVKIRDLDEDDLDPSKREGHTRLADLNLSHNQLDGVPYGLACLAPHLTRLNLSHNYISKFGDISNYPASLKELNLSYNELETNWESDKSSPSLTSVNVCVSPIYADKHQKR